MGVARIGAIKLRTSGIAVGYDLTSGGDSDPAFSPDGKQLAYLKLTESAQVYISNSDGKAEHAVTAGPGYARTMRQH